MGQVTVRRLAWSVPLLGGVSALVFLLASFGPATATSGLLGAREEFAAGATRSAISDLLDDGTWWQAWIGWWQGALGGDAGVSTTLRSPVTDVLLARLPWTLLLMGSGLVVGLLIAAPMAVAAARRPHGVAAATLRGAAWTLSALPAWVTGLGLMLVFSLTLRWLPAGGLTAPGDPLTPSSVATHLLLPAVAVGLGQVPWMMLHLHTALLEARSSDSVLAARLRGVDRRTVTLRHVLPMAVTPLIALTGSRLAEVVAGAALVETVFAWPGLGQALTGAATGQDLALLAGVSVLLTAVVLAGNLLADLALLLTDPRVGGHDL